MAQDLHTDCRAKQDSRLVLYKTLLAPWYRSLGLLAAVLPLALCQCAGVLGGSNRSAVVYALAPQEALPSPLDHPLSLAAPALAFSPGRYALSASQTESLKILAEDWRKNKTQVLILGFASWSLPTDYARSLSQRRAEAVRQTLIEMGVEAGFLHSVGYGHDQPSLGRKDEVKLYTLPGSPPPQRRMQESPENIPDLEA